MRAALTLALSLGSVLAVVFGGMTVASALMAEPAPHAFPEAAVASLWTTEPTRIDPASQGLERLPPRTVVPPQAAPKPSVDTGPAVASLDPVETGALQRAEAGLPLAHLDWCAGRYRSYNPDDNSYQPYDGPRRPCLSPYLDESGEDGLAMASADMYETAVAGPGALPTATVVSDGEPAYALPAADLASAGDHERWCAGRYRSYRAADNSYQPYGGPRRACRSPFSY